MRSSASEGRLPVAKRCDENLVREIQTEGPAESRKALEELFNRYKDFIRTRTHSYFLIGADRDDLIQEGMIGLYKAVLDYDPSHDASFRSFADICVRRQILTAVRNANRLKHYPLNSSISLNSTVQDDGEEQEYTLMDVLADTRIVDPEMIYISAEEKHRIENQIVDTLSSLEKQVLDLYIEGLDYQQIARVLERPPKSIDNALQRARHKVSGIARADKD